MNRVFLFLLLSFSLFAQESIRSNEFIDPGKVDALAPFPIGESLSLIQFDLPNDSLLQIVDSQIPNLDLNIGPASYQRIIPESIYREIYQIISPNLWQVIIEDYKINSNSRENWQQTQWGDEAAGTSESVGYDCMCTDGSDCLVIGYNDDWWDPLDYYGDAWWEFDPPNWASISSVKISVKGMQCDDLPLSSENYLSIKNNDCGWANDQWTATLSLDHTINGPYEIPTEMLEEIWCSEKIIPVIWSEDNYNVEWVKIEFQYENLPSAPNGLTAEVLGNDVHLSWNSPEAGFLPEPYNVIAEGSEYEGSPAITWSWQHDDYEQILYTDCVGTEFSAEYLSWLDDGYCDDGEWGLNFLCEEWGWDCGDCPDYQNMPDPNGWCAELRSGDDIVPKEIYHPVTTFDILYGNIQSDFERSANMFELNFNYNGTDYSFQSSDLSILVYGFDSGVNVCGNITAIDMQSTPWIYSQPSLDACATTNARTYNQEKNLQRNLLGYNVYRNGQLIASNIEQTTFIDENLEQGTYTYTVTAVYTLGESEHSGSATAELMFIGPSANFSVDISTGMAPFSVNFIDNSYPGNSDIIEWIWDFGDGAMGYEQYPNHIYEVAGTYSVSLTITDENGQSSSITEEDLIVVGGLPSTYPDWEVHIQDYEFNLTLAGLLYFDGEESEDTYDLVGAFVDGECRGIANPTYFPLTNKYTVNLMIYSNLSEGETVTFKAYNCSEEWTYDIVQETVEFVANDIIGNDLVPFELHAVTNQNYPDWSVYSPAFEFNMSLIGLLFIDGEESFDSNDLVGAFVDGECRGIANPTCFPMTEQYTVNMMIYSNVATGEAISFQVYDYSSDEVFDNVAESLTFETDAIIGNDLFPFEIHAEYESNIVLQNIDFLTGWNWFSINVESENMSLNTVLNSVVGYAEFIKSQTGFATYYEDYGWYGLELIDVREMYMIQTYSDILFSFEGYPVDFLDTPIELVNGWNWISYLPQTTNSLNNALVSIGSNGIFIKSQTGFATYYDDYGWYGLEVLEPGIGYMLEMSVEDQLIYGVPEVLAKVETEVISGESVLSRSLPDWNVNVFDYEFTATMTSVIIFIDEESTDENDLLAAFVGDECRGVVSPTYFPVNGRFTVNIMLYANENGETMTFRAYDASTDAVFEELFDADGNSYSYEFIINENSGNDITPIELYTNNLLDNDISIPNEYSLNSPYPNPFNPTTVISYSVPLESNDRLSLQIYNISGQLVETLVNEQLEAGYRQVIWNADNQPSGLYFVRMTTGDYVSTQKMLLLK
ncbi:MAG: T9SS type A sorting domain-containing protein [Candidatus Marinimicrobia bacterium]|nr:T9SS type A sorting domain-containing protein [Candidatus Neomarinimicrobiota bacterium]MBL7023658.1 T9SS type A sorting domain-containing protein [Candidatus Neomarinimicrobiota bacterium]MBL7109878.1 T9SS type A sorting domain-containing protein [Candidatus Neomarinimicrobiota bacterium]